jgi:hypothetical protein
MFCIITSSVLDLAAVVLCIVAVILCIVGYNGRSCFLLSTITSTIVYLVSFTMVVVVS